MSSLKNKNIVIAISGGIAAYKSLSLIRLFKKAGCEVKVVATSNALQFVTKLTVETLSQNKLYYDTFETSDSWEVGHIALSDWADCVVIAPATANIIGKFANGIADDALSSFLLATQKTVFIAPAMNDKMYENPVVRENIAKLARNGCRIIEPAEGFLACGTVAKGRMEEPELIFDMVARFFEAGRRFTGIKVLVSAGPTYEAIDPVRFIGNYSSGLMGFAIAETFASQGAEVTLVSGPTHLQIRNNSISRVNVISADEMFDACLRFSVTSDVVVMAAAVADYKPEKTASHKIKKNESLYCLNLVKNPDILAEIGKRKQENQYVAGFALETDNEMENALYKLQNKNLDLIVLNSLNNPQTGFNTLTNQVTVITKDGETIEGSLKDKNAVALDIVNIIYAKFAHKNK